MKVATHNVKAALSSTAAHTALNRVLARYPDMLMLQEWGPGREALLEQLPAPFEAMGKRRPVIVDRTALTPLATTLVTLARGRRVSKLPGRRKRLGDNVARVVFCRAVRGGHLVAGINFHLPAAVDQDGRPRGRSGRARLDQHAEAVLTLAVLWETLDKAGVEVYAAGDTNVDYFDDEREQHPAFPAARMDAARAVPCWYRNAPKRANDGTHHRRLIDTVWASRPATRVIQVSTPSDHDAVIATYGPTS